LEQLRSSVDGRLPLKPRDEVKTVDERLRFAITNKRLVKLSYNESLRVVEPHDYGVQKGAVRLLAYQQQSLGPKTSERGWRLFDVAKIEELAVLDAVFKGSRGASHQTHHVWDVVYARVT
jgi:predicted DNA-binding transcriptional regulator YafY